MCDQPTDLNVQSGVVRTDMDCHNCHKNFVAEVDHNVDGDHTIVCPHCGHEHYRRIEAGRITEGRWGTSNHRSKTYKAHDWRSGCLRMKTTTAAEFIRDRWLNFGG